MDLVHVRPRQRLQPGGKIVLVMTRWSTKDLTGKLIQEKANEDGDTWDIVELPAILPNKRPVWPEYWDIKELEKTRASIPVSNWNAQYMQQPTAEEGAIIKREWWICLLYTSPSPRDRQKSRMPSSA